MIPFVDLKSEYAVTGEEISQAILRVLKNGLFILGRKLKSLKKSFQNILGPNLG